MSPETGLLQRGIFRILHVAAGEQEGEPNFKYKFGIPRCACVSVPHDIGLDIMLVKVFTMLAQKTFLSALISSCLLSTAHAQEQQLDPLLVTASRLTATKTLPASVTIISAEQISRSPSRSLPDLLAENAGVNVRSLNEHKNSATVDIRGFGETAGQNTLILLDGRRLNDVDLSGVNYAAIPLQNIERIEIIRGSGAVLYGDGASGGVINIITKNPANTQNLAILSGSYGSDNFKEGNAFGSFSNEVIGINANINSISSNGYRDNNAFRQESGQLDIRVPLDQDELYLKLGGYKNKSDLPGVRNVNPSTGLNELSNDRRGSNNPDDWAEEQSEFITLGYTLQLSAQDVLVLDGSYRQRQQQSQFVFDGFGGAYSDTELNTFALTPRLIMDRQLAGKTMQIITGIDWYDYDYRSDRADFEANAGQPIHKLRVDQQSLAFYGQGSLAITDKTVLTTGLRTQQVRQAARDQFDPTASGGGFGSEAADLNNRQRENSFELGLWHQFDPNWSGYIRAGRSARFATVDELFQFNAQFQQVFADIKPQTATGGEIGVNYQSPQLTAQVALFQQNLEDEIRYNPVTFENENLDKTRRKGVEVSAAIPVNTWLTVTGNYTYLDARFRAGEFENQTIPLVPKHSYQLGFSANLPYEVQAALNWNHISATYFANDLNNDFGRKIPSYQTVNFKLSKAFHRLDLAITVNNIFDEKYYNFGVNGSAAVGNFNAYPLPERTVYATVSYQFD